MTQFLSLIVTILSAAITTQPTTISGRVSDAGGKAIEGATIYVIEASPLRTWNGPSPTEKPGVGMTLKSDAQGQFTLTPVDPRLNYELAVTADGFKTTVTHVSANGKKPALKLKPQPKELDEANVVTGHVVDSDSKPVAGALVSIAGEKIPNGHRFGGIGGVDQEALTDSEGKFMIVADKPGRQFDLRFEHPAYAPQLVIGSSGETVEITLSVGTSVVGRLMKDGQPLAGVEIGCSQADRNSEHFIGFFSIGTDAEGKFGFDHLPENTEMQVIASMRSLRERGACLPAAVKTNADPTPADAGDLEVGPAVTVSGQIVMPEGKKIPADAQVYVSIENTPDTGISKLDAAGKFSIPGVTPGVVRVNVYVNGYQFSSENVSYFHPYRSMLGKVDGDTTLKIKLEERTSDDSHLNNNDQFEKYQSQTLQGIPEDQ